MSRQHLPTVFAKLFKTWMMVPKNVRLDFIDEILGNSIEFENLKFAFVINMIYSYEMDNCQKDDEYTFYEYVYQADISPSCYKCVYDVIHNVLIESKNKNFVDVLEEIRDKNKEWISGIC